MFLKPVILILTVFLSSAAYAAIEDGLWQTACLRGLKKQQIYKNHHITTHEDFHQDAACNDHSFRFTTTGALHFNSEPNHFIEFTYESIYLTLYKDVLISDFNTRKVCGFDDWQLGQSREITGLRCALFTVDFEAPIPPNGHTRYGIYLREGLSLYYGQLTQELDGSTPERRPQQFNRSTEYIFQKTF